MDFESLRSLFLGLLSSISGKLLTFVHVCARFYLLRILDRRALCRLFESLCPIDDHLKPRTSQIQLFMNGGLSRYFNTNPNNHLMTSFSNAS